MNSCLYNKTHSVRFLWTICLLVLVLVYPLSAADYIGRQACVSCHAEQGKSWSGSHHDLAMQVADSNSVLGDFNDAEFSWFGVTSRFYRKDGKFVVRTDGKKGELEDFTVSYTFGVYPLQQYLVEFPGGRLQALDIAWDSRSKEEGGQRWFHLHPEDKITHEDVLHWSGPNLNWNYMCADCHSTNLRKNFDEKTATYQTSWSEINVSCEACHGPGSTHKKWADAKASGTEYKVAHKGLTVSLDERTGVSWQIDEKTGKPVRSKPNDSRAEIQVCAKCHSRRSQLTDNYVAGEPFMDGYRPSLLTEGLYYPDGQMQDEVYVWGSFRQSKMYHSGVTCSDCHDPHVADVKVPGEQVCYQCHAADVYSAKQHHQHVPGSAGANCVECHMPATTYMGVDRRHDHSFRIPRPDLSQSMGTPNACNRCHQDQTAAWSVQHMQTWYGSKPADYQQYAEALHRGRMASAEAGSLLLKLAMDGAQPSISRATAFSMLGGRADRNTLMLIQQGLSEEDPLLRLGALNALETVPVQQRIIGFPAVWDDVRAVRIQAARLMAGYPMEQISAEQQQMLKLVTQEYIQVQRYNAERPESQLNLAGIYTDLGQYEQAELAYRKALQLQPQFVPAYVNFAQMLSGRGREVEAANLLKSAIARLPQSADLYHALGLSQVRQKNTPAALESLKKAAELETENLRYQYVYAIALQSVGKLEQAIEVLRKVHQQQPADVDILYALVTFNQEAGEPGQALLYARKLQALFPGNPQVRDLIQGLENKTSG